MRDSFISGTQFLQCSDLHNLGTLRLEGNNLATIAKDQFLYKSVSLSHVIVADVSFFSNCLTFTLQVLE